MLSIVFLFFLLIQNAWFNGLISTKTLTLKNLILQLLFTVQLPIYTWSISDTVTLTSYLYIIFLVLYTFIFTWKLYIVSDSCLKVALDHWKLMRFSGVSGWHSFQIIAKMPPKILKIRILDNIYLWFKRWQICKG